jgi:hypothetical protein
MSFLLSHTPKNILKTVKIEDTTLSVSNSQEKVNVNSKRRHDEGFSYTVPSSTSKEYTLLILFKRLQDVDVILRNGFQK